MEATGVYWKPVWHVLDDGEFQLLLANAAHVKNVPGRKTDANDATWLADLMAHGLVRASFVPDRPTQQMRDLLRARKQFVRERSSHTQRIQKTLEDANIKARPSGDRYPGAFRPTHPQGAHRRPNRPTGHGNAGHRRIRATQEQLQAALTGWPSSHHRFLLKLYLDQIDMLDSAIIRLDKEVDRQVEPFRAAIERLSTIPGVNRLSAQSIVAEIGIDMSRFQTVGNLISWAGMCPKNDESAGKRRSTRMKKGACWLKPLLIQCAWAATRVKKSYLAAQFLRLRSRRGPQKAICAVAASILTAAYHMLKNATPFHDLGAAFFDNRSQQNKVRNLVNKLKNLGFQAQLTPLTA